MARWWLASAAPLLRHRSVRAGYHAKGGDVVGDDDTFEVDISGQGYFMLGHLNLDNPGMPRLFLARNDTSDTPEARPTAS